MAVLQDVAGLIALYPLLLLYSFCYCYLYTYTILTAPLFSLCTFLYL